MRKITTLLIACATLITFAGNSDIVVKDGKYFNQDGTLFTGLYEQFDQGVKSAEISVDNGLLSGTALYFHSNGTLKEEGKFVDGKRSGNWFKYTESGQLSGVASFANDKKDGKWSIWDDAGNLRFEMHYADGVKVGTWKIWDAEGNLTTKTFKQ